MVHRRKTLVLGRKAGPRRALLKQLATSIILHERVRTTERKAKAIRALVEKCVTIGKVNTLHHRRQLLRLLATEGAVAKVLEVLGPRYEKRPGGYLRITKLGARKGDAAPIAEISFV